MNYFIKIDIINNRNGSMLKLFNKKYIQGTIE